MFQEEDGWGGRKARGGVRDIDGVARCEEQDGLQAGSWGSMCWGSRRAFSGRRTASNTSSRTSEFTRSLTNMNTMLTMPITSNQMHQVINVSPCQSCPPCPSCLSCSCCWPFTCPYMHWQPYKKLQNKWLRTNECKSWVLYLLVIEPGTSDNWSGRRAYFDLALCLVICGQYDLPRLEEFWPIFRWLAPNSRLGTLLRYNWWSGPDGHEVGGGQQDYTFGIGWSLNKQR